MIDADKIVAALEAKELRNAQANPALISFGVVPVVDITSDDEGESLEIVLGSENLLPVGSEDRGRDMAGLLH